MERDPPNGCAVAQALIEQHHCEQLDALGRMYAAQLSDATTAAAATEEAHPPRACEAPQHSRAAPMPGAGQLQPAADGRNNHAVCGT